MVTSPSRRLRPLKRATRSFNKEVSMRVFNALNGIELKKLILTEVQKRLDNDGDFRVNLSYPIVSWEWELTVRVYPRDPAEFVVKAAGAVETVGPPPTPATPPPMDQPPPQALSSARPSPRTHLS